MQLKNIREYLQLRLSWSKQSKPKAPQTGCDSWALPSGDGAIGQSSLLFYIHMWCSCFSAFLSFFQCNSPRASFEAMKRPHSEQQLQAELQEITSSVYVPSSLNQEVLQPSYKMPTSHKIQADPLSKEMMRDLLYGFQNTTPELLFLMDSFQKLHVMKWSFYPELY